MTPSKLRAALALLLLAVLAAASLYAAARQAPLLRNQAAQVRLNGDDLTHWGERLSTLLPYLPQTGQVGYLSEQDFPGLDFNPIDQNEEMAMSQYVLAPRILAHGHDLPYVIGNIAPLSPEQVQAAVALLGLRVERSFGLGIYLFRQAGP